MFAFLRSLQYVNTLHDFHLFYYLLLFVQLEQLFVIAKLFVVGLSYCGRIADRNNNRKRWAFTPRISATSLHKQRIPLFQKKSESLDRFHRL
jgi:hypothetical protein